MKRIGKIFGVLKYILYIVGVFLALSEANNYLELAVSKIIMEFRLVNTILLVLLMLSGIAVSIFCKKIYLMDNVVLSDEFEFGVSRYKLDILINMGLSIITLTIAILVPVVIQLHYTEMFLYSTILKSLVYINIINLIDSILYILFIGLDYAKIRKTSC